MARAKSTARATARRRHAAEIRAQQADGQQQVATEEPAPPRRQGARAEQPERQNAPAPGQRVGLFQAMRLANRPVHIVDDLRYVPNLVLRTHGVWPGALMIAIAGIGAFGGFASDSLFKTYLDFVLWPFPIVPATLAGFLAPRAGWLAGLLVSVVGAVVTDAILMWNPAIFLQPGASVGYGAVFLLFITYGTLFAALAAWYRRFLNYMTPANASGRGGRQQQRPGSSTPASRRR